MRLIGCGNDDNRPFETLFAKIVFDKLPHFTATLADQCDDIDVRAGIARNHAQQGALADTASAEYSDTLAVPVVRRPSITRTPV
jgi:hypothetical protein